MNVELEEYAQRLSGMLERRTGVMLFFFSVLYLSFACSLASQRLLWNDELFTLYFSRLSNSDLWDALSTGADQIPPLSILLTRASISVLGESKLAIRLPEVAGFWLLSVFLFGFVKRRLSTLYAFGAMLIPWITASFSYAHEARPYSLMMGFGAASLYSWQSATEGRHRAISLAGLAIGAAAALSCHYYGAFVLFALSVGELVRSFIRKKPDLSVWLAFVAALAPLLMFRSLVQAARLYSATFWAKPQWVSIGSFYDFLLRPLLLPFLAAAVLAALSLYFFANRGVTRPEHSLSFPAHELFAALGFLFIPVAEVVFAKLCSAGFANRYALQAIIGVSILLVLLFWEFFGGRPLVGLTILSLFTLWFVVSQVRAGKKVEGELVDRVEICRLLEQEGAPLDITSWHSNWILELGYSCSPALRSRLVYLADPKAAIRFTGKDTVDRGLLDLKPWFPVRVDPYKTYTGAHPRFLLCGYTEAQDWNWLLYSVLEDNLRVELVARYRHNFYVFMVSQKNQS